MSPRADPDGIELSDGAHDYLTAFRLRFPRSERQKHGVAAGNGRFPTMNDELDSDSDAQTYNDPDALLSAAWYATECDYAYADPDTRLNTKMTRRGAMAAGAGVVMLGLGASTATAATSLNYDSGLVPNPEIRVDETIEEHDRSEMSSPLEFIDDGGEEATLTDDGATLASRPEDDDDDDPVPHNVLSLRADHIYDGEFYLTPRDRTFENADGDEEDVTILDEQHWTAEEDVTVSEADVGHGGPALGITTDGIADGATSAATFDEISIDETSRNYLAMVLNVVDLPEAAEVEIALLDEAAAELSVFVADAMDPMDDDVLTDSEGYGQVAQVQLGDLEGEIDEIDSVEVRVSDADVDLEIAGWGLNRTSRWEFGTREYLDEDDEIDTETVREPSGWFEITGVDTLPDMFSNAVIHDLGVEIEYRAEDLPSEQVFVEWSDGDLYDRVGQFIYTFKVPSQFALSPDIEGLIYEQSLGDGRYDTLETIVDADDAVEGDDVDDYSWTDHTGELGDEEDELELTSVFTDGEYVAVHYEVKYHADEEETATSPPAAAGPTGQESGGVFSRLFSVPGMIMGGITGLGLWSYFREGDR